MVYLLPVIPPENKVRKGDIVALQIEHSSTDIKMKTTRYTRFVLATVAHANRKGTATRVMLAGQTHSIEVARLGKVFTLVAKQVAAKRLVDATTYPGTEFSSADELRAAIIATEDQAPAPPSVPFVDVSNETAYGSTVKLSKAVRCF